MSITHSSPQIVHCALSLLKPYRRNARTHTKKQIQQIADSIERFGFTNPILVHANGTIVAGHGRVLAAKLLGLATVPTLDVSYLSEADLRAYVIADNKLALNAGWDPDILAGEFQALIDLGYDLDRTGFSNAEIDLTLDAANDRDTNAKADPLDAIPTVGEVAICKAGDVWHLGKHRLVCGDARLPGTYRLLLGDEKVDLIFTDPPYNVPIDGHVTGNGRIRHREFAFAAGEMSEGAFTGFLTETLGSMAQMARDGAIAFVCMDWRHMGELLIAGKQVFSELKNLCVWNKSNGGMGTFYRSKHELIFVFKVGSGPHINTFGLGETGRPRTNVWDYPGISSMTSGRADALAMHPTVKPTALVADAIRDCSKRGQIMLDGFAGSGTTLIAAHACGRIARLVEFAPLYCDVILRRYRLVTGKEPVRQLDERSFGDLEVELPGSAS